MSADWLTPDLLLSLCLGFSLAAACGLRVFVPFLVASGAALLGHLPLSPGFGWLGTWPAFAMLAAATVVEIAAYYVPWLDHLLDAAAAPLAVLGGVLLTASTLTEVSPLVRWTMAVVAGGGAAGLTQLSTTALRAASTALTGGLGNWVVSTLEALGAFLLALLAVVVPALVAMTAALLLLAALRRRALRRP